jgi:hypothetical protein
MQGSFLRFYVHEGQRHQRRLVWEWLLEQAGERRQGSVQASH